MSVCEVCGRKGKWQSHHPTGRNHADEYFDPEFTVALCHDHHTLCHDDWYTLNLAKSPASRGVGVVEFRLRRAAATLARIDRTGKGVLTRVAGFLVACADDLARLSG